MRSLDLGGARSSDSDDVDSWIRFDPDVRGGCGNVSQAIEEHYRDVLENVPGISPEIQIGILNLEWCQRRL